MGGVGRILENGRMNDQRRKEERLSGMSSRKVATTIYITQEQDQKLKMLSEATGASMAQYIRDGIDLVLKQHADRLPRQLGLLLSDD